MTYANSSIHKRTMKKVSCFSRRRCDCGCGGRATHMGMANGCGMVIGCELPIRRWVRAGLV